MAVAVAGSLITAAVLGAIAAMFRRARRRWRPINVTVERVIPEGWRVVLPAGLPADAANLTTNELTSPPAVYEWLCDRGAIDHFETTLRLYVEGLSDRTVVVCNIGVELDRSVPAECTLVSSPTAGANSATLLMFELDTDPVDAWEWQDQSGPRVKVGGAPFFATNNITLGKNEVHEVIVVGRTALHHCRWTLAFDVQVGRRRTTIRVDNAGRPFETVGEPSSGFKERIHWAWYQGGGFAPEPGYDD